MADSRNISGQYYIPGKLTIKADVLHMQAWHSEKV